MRGRGSRRDAVLFLGGAIAAGVVLRLLVFSGQGFPTDVGTFQAWAERLAALGPGAFYAPGYFSDYPPGFLYVLWLVGALFDGEALRLAVKALSIPADVAIAVLLYDLVRRHGGATAGAFAGALWMLQPAPIFAGPFWGQVDAWGTLPYLGALVAAGRGRWIAAGTLAAVAGMIKPQFGLVALVVVAAAVIELARSGRGRPLAEVAGAGIATAFALALPFRLSTGGLIDLVRSASETYPYTSLYAFNGWSIVGDFWKPDASYVVTGAVLLLAGLAASLLPLWWRRDTATLLAVGAFAAMAFYFLPTRAHERYLFPAFALLVPFAVTRARILVPYLVMALTFWATLYFAFTRYEMTKLVPPELVEQTLFSRNGQIAIALLMIGSAAVLVWRLARGEAVLRPSEGVTAVLGAPSAAGAWRLPAGLGRGHAPTKRDVMVALAVALAVVATRGYRLDWPRDMYFDEVYHARTAFELLAQREPYEWTHPHLAKEIMALGILAFGDDRIEATEPAPVGATAFAVAGDGTRAYGFADGRYVVGVGPAERLDGPVRAIGFDGTADVAVTDRSLYASGRRIPLADGPPTALAVSNGRAIVGTRSGVEIHLLGQQAAPLRVAIPTVALTIGPNENTLYVADASETIHVVDLATGKETATLSGGGPIASLAYANAAERLYVGRADEAAIDRYEPPKADQPASGGSFIGTVPLSNGRTGELSGPVRALALVPRTQFLYALAGDRLAVIETHGASPFTAIAVHGSMLGVDGIGDRLVVAGEGSAEIVPTGRHALAWRLPGVLAAAVLAFFVVLIARRLFASEVIPLLAGLAVVLDGSMFAQARIGMNDIYVATFLVAGWYFAVAAHDPRRSATADLLIAGVLFGLAAASKWAAFYALAGLGLYAVVVTAYAWSRERPGTGGPFDLAAPRGPAWVFGGRANAPLLLLCFFAIPLALYVATYAQWFGGPTIPYGWDLRELTQQMYWYHSGLTAPHPAGSPWWSWPFVLKPVYWYLGTPGGNETAVIYDAGNVVLFWGGVVAFGWAAVAAVRARSWGLGIALFALLTQYVAWVPISRVLFFYHFFTALPFYLLVLAAALGALWERGRQRAVAAYLAVAAAAFVYFYPFVSGLPVPAAQAAAFFILPTWQYDCQFYPSFHCALGPAAQVPWQEVLGRILIAVAFAAAALAAAVAWGGLGPAHAREWLGRLGADRAGGEDP